MAAPGPEPRPRRVTSSAALRQARAPNVAWPPPPSPSGLPRRAHGGPPLPRRRLGPDSRPLLGGHRWEGLAGSSGVTPRSWRPGTATPGLGALWTRGGTREGGWGGAMVGDVRGWGRREPPDAPLGLCPRAGVDLFLPPRWMSAVTVHISCQLQEIVTWKPQAAERCVL